MKREFDPKVGIRIREKREAFHLSREEFAEAADLSANFLSSVELGQKGLSAFSLMKICRALGVSADTFLFGSENSFDCMRVAELLSGLDESYLPYVEELLGAYMKSIVLARGKKEITVE